jgi:hypothetical protein
MDPTNVIDSFLSTRKATVAHPRPAFGPTTQFTPFGRKEYFNVTPIDNEGVFDSESGATEGAASRSRNRRHLNVYQLFLFLLKVGR